MRLSPHDERHGFASAGFILSFLLLLLLLASPSHAQDADFATGVEAYEARQYSRAISAFSRVEQSDPAYVDPQHGPVALWFGRTLLASEDTSRALSVWERGLKTLAEEADSYDLALADALVTTTFAARHSEAYAAASSAYLDLLSHADSTLTEEDEAILRKHVAQMAFLLDGGWEQHIFSSRSNTYPDRWEFAEGAGASLVSWWNREDPAPASAGNVRLVEHLERVSDALDSYHHRRRLAGFDERGEIYVRLGPPTRSTRLLSFTLAQSLSRHATIQPENEIWAYPEHGSDAVYLFTRGTRGFEVGGVFDLLPSSIRNRAQMPLVGVFGLQDFLNQLSFYHQAYGGFLDDLERTLEEALTEYDVVEMGDGRMMAFAMIERPTTQQLDWVDPATGRTPRAYIGDIRSHARQREDELIQKREETVPRYQTDAFGDALPLDVATRTVRLLNDDGSTRTEVYWAPRPGSLHPSDGQKFALTQQGHRPVPDFRLRSSLVHLDSNYNRERVDMAEFEVEAHMADVDRTIPPQHFVIAETGDPAHLSLQVEQLVESRQDESEGEELLMKRALVRLDSLQPLCDGRTQLEISDLRPLLLPDPDLAPQLLAARPAVIRSLVYPYEVLPANSNLVLNFEVYNLNVGDDDRARYTVEYELHRREETRGLWQRIRGGPDEQRTTTAFERESNDRQTEEIILLELDELPAGGTLRVTVHVTDEYSGETRSRDVLFDVLSDEE